MRFIISVILLFCLSCSSSLQKPSFIIGKWKRITQDSSKVTYEIWDENFSGVGYTLQQNDTVFKELMHIKTINDNLCFEVTGVNENPTIFKVIELTSNSITCENEDNEFPKIISYWMENKQLKAKVANDDFAVDFAFMKME
jgi:hypothetical protein